jgi:hypothetical protein
MTRKTGLQSVVPLLSTLVLACAAGSTESQASALTSGARVQVTIASADWATLLANPVQLDGKHRGPPPEALEACSGRATGDTCSFSHDGREVAGTCRAGRDGSGQVACAPERPHRAPPPEALSACANSAADAACSFSIEGRTVDGTCRQGPDGAALACAPARRGHGGGHGGHGGHGPRGGVAATVNVEGQALEGHVVALPVTEGEARKLMIRVKDGTGGGYALVPEPTGSSGRPVPADAPRVQLQVDHGNGLTDFGTYVQLVRPARGGGEGADGARPQRR